MDTQRLVSDSMSCLGHKNHIFLKIHIWKFKITFDNLIVFGKKNRLIYNFVFDHVIHVMVLNTVLDDKQKDFTVPTNFIP